MAFRFRDQRITPEQYAEYIGRVDGEASGDLKRVTDLIDLDRLKLIRAADCAGYKSISTGIPITTRAAD